MLLPVARHELSFWHGGSRLVGDLVLPASGGPHPLVLVVSDTGATERDQSSWLDGLAGAGVASFTWSRAGQGPRPVDPVRRTTHQAREVLAAMDRLCCLPELDPDAVALVGWGEGGWAAAQATTFSSRVRALVLAGTPMTSPVLLAEHRLIRYLCDFGYAGSDVDVARDVVRRRLAGVLAGQSVAELDAMDTGHRRAAWYQALLAVDAFARPAPAVLAADPLPTLSAVSAPVLALFGEQDPTLPLDECVRGVRTALCEAGHEDHRVAVDRGADRALRVRPGHGLGRLIDGRHRFGEWPAGLTAVIVDWLDGRIREPHDLPAFPPPALPGEVTGPSVRGVPLREPRPLLPVRQVRRRISR